ncbi:hypothetical protein [Wujia chipingensis]|uniref:SGNH/GDSL hydrolase family protein n=1 Tax=Wujia chipingensis TaxID=2763670 RepID=A0A7G9FNZ5_9FIRM|nr:hypothetical protein [Wujia chipingensis]QNM00277.1 hypothetical protein H9Q76_03020 [Wujia chipingensis]
MQASENKKIEKKKSVNTEIANTKNVRHGIWLRVISFAVVVILLLIASGKLCDPIRLGLQDSVSERERYLLHLLSEPEEMVDVAILGDSESYTLVSTYQLWKEAGIASYIGGQSGQWIGESYFSLKKILKRQSPKVLILETNEFFSRGDASVIKDAAKSAQEFARQMFPILKYHRFWKMEPADPKLQTTIFNGFELRAAVAPYTGGVYMHATDDRTPVTFITRYYLDKIKRLRDAHGTKLLFVTAPSPVNHTMQRHNEVQALADALAVPYLDLNLNTEELGIDWNLDTLDGGDHLNYTGCQKATAYLQRYMQTHYTLPDRRDDVRYEAWNKQAEEFEKLLPQP